MSIDMDSSTESLTFHLGILTSREPNVDDPEYPHSPQYTRWIQVWRVVAEVDSNSCVTGLTPVMLSSFREEYEPACFCFRLKDQLVAYSLFYSHTQVGPLNSGHKIIIVDWKTNQGDWLNYARRIVPRTKASVSSS